MINVGDHTDIVIAAQIGRQVDSGCSGVGLSHCQGAGRGNRAEHYQPGVAPGVAGNQNNLVRPRLIGVRLALIQHLPADGQRAATLRCGRYLHRRHRKVGIGNRRTYRRGACRVVAVIALEKRGTRAGIRHIGIHGNLQIADAVCALRQRERKAARYRAAGGQLTLGNVPGQQAAGHGLARVGIDDGDLIEPAHGNGSRTVVDVVPLHSDSASCLHRRQRGELEVGHGKIGRVGLRFSEGVIGDAIAGGVILGNDVVDVGNDLERKLANTVHATWPAELHDPLPRCTDIKLCLVLDLPGGHDIASRCVGHLQLLGPGLRDGRCTGIGRCPGNRDGLTFGPTRHRTDLEIADLQIREGLVGRKNADHRLVVQFQRLRNDIVRIGDDNEADIACPDIVSRYGNRDLPAQAVAGGKAGTRRIIELVRTNNGVGICIDQHQLVLPDAIGFSITLIDVVPADRNLAAGGDSTAVSTGDTQVIDDEIGARQAVGIGNIKITQADRRSNRHLNGIKAVGIAGAAILNRALHHERICAADRNGHQSTIGAEGYFREYRLAVLVKQAPAGKAIVTQTLEIILVARICRKLVHIHGVGRIQRTSHYGICGQRSRLAGIRYPEIVEILPTGIPESLGCQDISTRRRNSHQAAVCT